MYKSNTEARSRNHCCSGKAIGLTYSVCVSVALVIRHVKRVRRTVVCGLTGSIIFLPHYLTKGTISVKRYRT